MKTIFLLLDLIKLHELYHIKQFSPGAKNGKHEKYLEIGATIDTLILCDEIHKKINKIPLDDEVEYKKTLKNIENEHINPGVFINQMRKIKTENNFENWGQVLMSDNGMDYIKKHLIANLKFMILYKFLLIFNFIVAFFLKNNFLNKYSLCKI